MKNTFYFTAILLLLSCGTSKNKETKDEKKVTPEILWNEMETSEANESIDYTKRKVFHGSETIFTDLIHTKLEVSFDWNKSWLIGKATITAKPHFYASDSLILDAKGMEIKTISISNKSLNYAYDSSILRIKLDRLYSRNENYTIVIDYIAKPDERTTSGSSAITSDKGLYFINPKGEEKDVMPQIWTQGETESSSVWFPTIDAPNVKTSQEIFITVDKKYITLSNGKLLKSTENSNGTRTDHWKQDLPHAPYLFMMGVGEFKVVKDSYTRPNGSVMEVNYYVEPEWESHAKAIFGETPAMIKFFSELTGVEYPWDKYHQIVVRDYVSGAMENTGAVIFGDYAYKTKRELLDGDDNSTIAHELFHHWFGDLVTCESWSNLPLNESFANYSQYLWDEHRYGLDEADYNAENEKYGYYQSAENGGHHNLIWYNYEDKEQMFDGHSYNKGGRILHMLRNYLGDEAFFLGLKTYLKTNQFKAAEFHHLRQAFEDVSGQDLTWFFSQWFEASGHPMLDVEQIFDASTQSLTLKVFQNQELSKTPLYLLPVQVSIVDDAGEHTHKIRIDKLENTFTFPVNGNLKNVLFDKQQCLLGIIDEAKPQEQFIHQYYNGKRYLARRNALVNGTKEINLASEKLILDALDDTFWDIRVLAIEKASSLKDEQLNKAIDKIKQLALNDKKSDVRAEALDFLLKKLSSIDFEDICISVIKKDSSYMVISNALLGLNKINPSLAVEKTKAFENDFSSKIIATCAQIYSGRKESSYFTYFERILNANKAKYYDAIITLNSFTAYSANQAIDIQEKVLAIYKTQYDKGGAYIKMFMPQNLNYFIKNLDSKIAENQLKIEGFEKNKDFVEADKTRKNSSRLEKVKSEMKEFLSSIEKK
jgi:aminopeptidase N